MASFLDRERTVAGPGFNRWLVPPAALCVHLSIGQAYAFSVFNLPMTRLLGGTTPSPDDWSLAELGWIFSIAIVFLGIASAIFGSWLDRVGPRRAMFTAACCFGGGFLVSAVGVALHQLWIIYLGYGVLGGCGLGIGYISPVKTLMSWFPDRPGMATGLAIMGFGGGALIASPLSVMLMQALGTAGHPGVAPTFVVLGVLYFSFMIFGATIVRVPPAGWLPAGMVAAPRPGVAANAGDLDPDQALRTPQFYLLWWVLCLNVTAGIGVLGQASAMSQEMFHGRISATAAAGFVGLLSLFNMVGRFFWASTSDLIGRRATYTIFFLLGIALYAVVPSTAQAGSVVLFVLCYGVILSMYGGGFATIPAYLRDVFGLQYVGAIHGRLLTAWSAAGIFGPVLVNYIRAYEIAHGVARADSYTITMYLMAGLLLIGLICNLLVRPLRAPAAVGLPTLSLEEKPQ
ncbi:MAG: OFA family MFS transporter [Acidisphaera sp.]|nr:OFA family MFS transporter [Acidisphaera sp.]